jgi:hypothetical protein
MYRVLIPILLIILQSIQPGWSQQVILGSGSGSTAETTNSTADVPPVPPAPQDPPLLATSQEDQEEVAAATSEEFFNALEQIDDSLKNLDDLKKLADQFRRVTPDREIEIRQLQTRINQQRQKLEEKRAELEVMGAKLRGHAKALRIYQEEMGKRMGLPGEPPGPEMMPGMPGGGMMGGMGTVGGMGMGMGGMMGGGTGFGTQPEMDMRAIPLKEAVPEKMLEMVNPLMGPMGTFVYDPKTRVVILRGNEAALDRAQQFIEKLTDTYAHALAARGIDPFAAETVEVNVPTEDSQTIQIEALLLEGNKVEDTTREVAETLLPKEALAIGLQPDDLKPFGRLELLAVGPMVLQSVINPDKGLEIRTRLGEYRIEMEIEGKMAQIQLKWADRGGENTPLLSNVISASTFDRPILVGSVNPDQANTVILVIRLKRI